MRGSDYAELRAFAAIVEHGSFVRAAAHLRVSPSALSQTIRSLEMRLGVRLLNRTTRSVAPSEAGARLLAGLLPAFANIAEALDAALAVGRTVAGTLRINAPRDAAIYFLSPLVVPFLDTCPGVRLDIETDDRLVDIVADGFHAGVRLHEKLQSDMVATPLSGDLEMAVVASPAYLARYGVPLVPRDLLGHRCLNCRMPTDGSLYRWEFARGKETLDLAVEGPIVISDPRTLALVARDSGGIAYLFSYHVCDMLADGTLVRILADWTPCFPGFFLYHPAQPQTPPTLKAFIDFVRVSGAFGSAAG